MVILAFWLNFDVKIIEEEAKFAREGKKKTIILEGILAN